jgi:hypothetical protein
MTAPRSARNVAMTLETLRWLPARQLGQQDDIEFRVGVWPVFFKIDGSTACVSDVPDETQGKLVGTVTISDTSSWPGSLAGAALARPAPREMTLFKGQGRGSCKCANSGARRGIR